jgi:phosphoserine phosphatase
MLHNVYDFDKTIYQNDSTADFYLFCLKRHPAILAEIPIFLAYTVLFLFRLCSITVYKEKFFRFLRHVDSIDELILQFWDMNHDKVKEFYINGRRDSDIIISASPEFLLRPVCDSLNIKNLIASRVDKNTGRYSGENCWGAEKLRRLREEMGNTAICEFYSDSLSDAPLAEIAEKAYIVRDNNIMSWSEYRPAFTEKIRLGLFS